MKDKVGKKGRGRRVTGGLFKDLQTQLYFPGVRFTLRPKGKKQYYHKKNKFKC